MVAVVERRGAWYAAAAIAVGAAVAVVLGGYGRTHQGNGQAIGGFTFGFPSLLQMKVWFAVAAGCLALIQLGTALWIYGRLGRPAPSWAGALHRSTGTLAILISLPVAANCLWALGFQTYSTRVLVHSVAGCLFYGAFVTKVLGLHRGSAPGWLVTLAGGLVFALLVTVVLTSSAWYLTAGSPGY